MLARLADLVGRGGVVVLSGAGLSTESGIPGYRGTGASLRSYTPMTHQAFVHDPAARRRYWARSHVGWQVMVRAEPNVGHLAVASLERFGIVVGTITQNVDGLHTTAGSRGVVELHGRLDRVACLRCAARSPRAEIARRLAEANRGWQGSAREVNPDGDVDLADDLIERFVVVDCPRCGGVLMPDVVYFGGTVPPERVAAAQELVDRASLVLVLGSSLTVFSGRRFVTRAAKAGTPVAIVNEGPTQADGMATVKVEALLGETLQGLLSMVEARASVGGTDRG